MMIAANVAADRRLRRPVRTSAARSRRWASSALLLFTVGFTFGFGALVWVYAGESFPARLRSMGSSAMLTSDLVANAIVAASSSPCSIRSAVPGTFAVFGVLALASFAFVYRIAPETKGRQLEDIRHFWENAGRWPSDEEIAKASDQS